MLTAIKNFPEQFAYQPVIKNKKLFAKPAKKFLILGMGGSHLAADLLLAIDPNLAIEIYSDYGLPGKSLKDYLIIANSYSGNTAEVISGLKMALAKKLNVLVIATGGQLISLAKKNKLSYIQLPNWKIQPRQALGLNARALLKAMGSHKHLVQSHELADILKPNTLEKRGQTLAEKLVDRTPIIYSSNKNFALAYTWKIKFNENTKIPAFYNTLPELNHNEMTGFDVRANTKKLSEKFSFIFLVDEYDFAANQARFQVLAKLYRKRELAVDIIKVGGQNQWLKVINNILLADWVSYYLAKHYHIDPCPVPMVEEFKKMI